MHSVVVAGLVFVCALSGLLLGMFLRTRLHERHLTKEVRDVVNLGTATVVTLTSLVLGLLVATAKSSFDTRSSEIKEYSARVAMLDRALGLYGPEGQPARQTLRAYFARKVDELWPERGSAPHVTEETLDVLEHMVVALSPTTKSQRWLRPQMLKLLGELASTRLMLFEQSSTSSIPAPFLYVLAFWVTAIFFSFGLFAPFNPLVLTVLCISALSIAGAVFLVLEMDRPFSGLIQISSAPARKTLQRLGR
jgi:Protein of unknown function (DUF4239)